MRPVDLPLPLNLLQGIEAHDAKKLDEMFKLVAKKVGCTPPSVDLVGLAATVVAFEASYTTEMKAIPSLSQILREWPELVRAFKVGPDMMISDPHVEEWKIDLIRAALLELERQDLLAYHRTQMLLTSEGAGSGDYGALTIKVTPELKSIVGRLV